tara:strand:- start:185 stop:586 length:402 start_codon:yes stop_codon:yes gene_type:complete
MKISKKMDLILKELQKVSTLLSAPDAVSEPKPEFLPSKKSRATFPDLLQMVEYITEQSLPLRYAEALLEWYLKGNLPSPENLRSAKRSALLNVELGFVLGKNDEKEILLFSNIQLTLENFNTSINLFEHEKEV